MRHFAPVCCNSWSNAPKQNGGASLHRRPVDHRLFSHKSKGFGFQKFRPGSPPFNLALSVAPAQFGTLRTRNALFGLHGPANRVVARIMRLYLGNGFVAVRLVAHIDLLIGGQGTLHGRHLRKANLAVRGTADVANSFRGFGSPASNRHCAQQDQRQPPQRPYLQFRH